MESPVQKRAWTALTSRLREVSLSLEEEHWIGGAHVRRLADNALPGLPLGHLERLRAQLELGAGGELTPTRTGKRRAHAPYSSAVFALNLFGRWLDDEERLSVCGVRGFEPELRLEHKLKIAHGGGIANLDVFVERDGLVFGIECKLTETLERHDSVDWKPPYFRPVMAELLGAGWRSVLQASLSGSWQAAHLGVEQLIKHALALASHHRGAERHLLYCFWESANADAIPDVLAHRAELAQFVDRLGDDAKPRLHVRTYKDVLAEWADLPSPSWLGRHIAELRTRYDVAI
jgi:hypothetical protein